MDSFEGSSGKNEFIENMKKRTKLYVIRSTKLFQSLPKQMRRVYLVNSFYVQHLRLPPTIVQFAGQEVEPSFSLNSALQLKKLMNRCFGLRY